MNWLLSGSMLLLATLGMKPAEDRGVHREAVVASAFEFTDFGCLHATLCWSTAGFDLCAEDAAIVEGRLSPDVCAVEATPPSEEAGATTEAEPSFMLTFDPSMDSIFWIVLEQRVDNVRDRVRMSCWTDADDIGDDSVAVVIESAAPMQPGEVYANGRLGFLTEYAGVAACRIDGADVVDIAIWAW